MTTLLLNGRIHSLTHPDATAMAVRDGVVAWLGSNDVGRDQFPAADVIDLDGGFVAPGFVDSHSHLTATGLTLTGLDLRPATSRQHCLRIIADYAAAHPGQPVRGHGWDESGWPENEAPTTDDLGAVLGDGPAYLALVDVHFPLASTGLRRPVPRLADAAGFTAQQPLVGDAHHLARAAARDLLTDEQLAEAHAAELEAAAGAGIVAVHECAGPDIGGLDDWQQLRDTDHGVEVIGYWGEAVTSPAQARERPDDTGARGLAGDLFIDGALGSRTAWLHEPYTDNFALLASQGVPLAFGSDALVTSLDPWVGVCAPANHRTPGSAVSARAAFAAATRGDWRAAGVRDGITGTLTPGVPASYAVWDTGELDVSAPHDAVQRSSSDPRSRVAALPRLGPTDALPRCRQTVHRGAVIHG